CAGRGRTTTAEEQPWRALYRGRGIGARVPESGGADGGAVHPEPVQRGREQPVVQDGRPGEVAGERRAVVCGTSRRPGEDSRIPDRVGRDRAAVGWVGGSRRSGGGGAGGYTGPEAIGGLCGAERVPGAGGGAGGDQGGVDQRLPGGVGGPVARLHGAGAL